MARRALITGITGQDGSYLAEFLLEKNYRVYGLVRRSSTINFERIAHLHTEKDMSREAVWWAADLVPEHFPHSGLRPGIYLHILPRFE